MQFVVRTFLLTTVCSMLLLACSKPVETTARPAAVAAPADHVTDGEVTTHVKTALSSEPSLAGLDITVVTTNGDIRLTGVVQSQVQIETAIRIARAAEGGHTIHDELTVKQ